MLSSVAGFFVSEQKQVIMQMRLLPLMLVLVLVILVPVPALVLRIRYQRYSLAEEEANLAGDLPLGSVESAASIGMDLDDIGEF